jgi:serine/threonine protein phosphatase PrpC
MLIGDGLGAIVADGAGGMPGGEVAAQTVAETARAWLGVERRLPTAPEWAEWLTALDRRMAETPFMGQAAVVGVSVSSEGISGASVGDCQALLIGMDGTLDLTERQHRKPLIGSGVCVAVAFARPWRGGRLIVGSDGLMRFASDGALRTAASDPDVVAAAARLAESVRLPNGEVWDDAAGLVCRWDDAGQMRGSR